MPFFKPEIHQKPPDSLQQKEAQIVAVRDLSFSLSLWHPGSLIHVNSPYSPEVCYQRRLSENLPKHHFFQGVLFSAKLQGCIQTKLVGGFNPSENY